MHRLPSSRGGAVVPQKAFLQTSFPIHKPRVTGDLAPRINSPVFNITFHRLISSAALTKHTRYPLVGRSQHKTSRTALLTRNSPPRDTVVGRSRVSFSTTPQLNGKKKAEPPTEEEVDEEEEENEEFDENENGEEGEEYTRSSAVDDEEEEEEGEETGSHITTSEKYDDEDEEGDEDGSGSGSGSGTGTGTHTASGLDPLDENYEDDGEGSEEVDDATEESSEAPPPPPPKKGRR